MVVTPAKARVHCATVELIAWTVEHWIPAFAGMTEVWHGGRDSATPSVLAGYGAAIQLGITSAPR